MTGKSPSPAGNGPAGDRNGELPTQLAISAGALK